MRADFIRDLPDWRGAAKLWKLSRQVQCLAYGKRKSHRKAKTQYVITSAVRVPFSGPETYIFPADAQGKPLCYMELPGSFQGALDQVRAIQRMCAHFTKPSKEPQ